MSRDFLDHGVLARLGNLPIFSRKPMQGLVSGRHKSPFRGSSVEFAQYRKYVEGDDIRRLDWKTYGRSDRYYVKEFEADTNLRAYLLLDCSGSMKFAGADEKGRRNTEPPKLAYAKKLAASLAYLLIGQGDAAGLTAQADTTRGKVPPRRSPAHLQHVYHILENTEAKGGTALSAALHELAESVRQRAQIMILSDLFLDLGELKDALSHLRYRKHDVAVFHLIDREELTFPFDRPHRFVDLEDHSSIVLDPAEIADKYREVFHHYLEAVRKLCLRQNADYRLTLTDQDYEKVLADFLLSRASRNK